MHPETANLMASLHRDELMREAEHARLAALAHPRPRHPRLMTVRNALGYRLVEAGLHLLVVPRAATR